MWLRRWWVGHIYRREESMKGEKTDAWHRKQNVNEDSEGERHQEKYQGEQQEVEAMRQRELRDGGMVVVVVVVREGLMCPSWGEAGQKWLSVELN